MKRINPHIAFIIIIFILTLFFFKSLLHTGVIPNNIHYINDLAFVSYNTKEALANNELPLWTPYFYAGHPLLAIPENYMFDLNFLLVYLFRNIYLAMNLSLILYFFISGLGMYLLAYSLTENRKSSFISAFIYMFNGFMHSFILNGNINILEGYALIPLIFLFVHKALKTKELIFYGVLAGIFFALQIFSGSIILFFYTAFIAMLYIAFNLISKNFIGALAKSFFVGIIIILIALSLASIKFLPSVEFTKMSSRSAGVSFKEFLGSPIELKNTIRILVSDIGFNDVSGAVGVLGFLLLLFSLSNYKKKMVIFSFILIIFSILFASGTFVADIMYKLPGFSSLRHVERSLVFFVFSSSILAAYGFVSFSEKVKKYVKYENVVFAAVIILIAAELIFLHQFPMSSKIIQPEDINLLEHIGKDNSKFRTINLALKDIIGAAGYNYYAQKGISEAKGGGGIWINDYVNFLAVAQQTLSSKLLAVLNVKYIVADSEVKADGFTLVNKFNECDNCALPEAFGPYLYKNEEVMPRYYVVPNAVLIVGDNSVVKQLTYSLIINSLDQKNAVLVEGANINDYDISFLKKFKAIILVKDSADRNSISKLKEYAEQGGMIIPDVINGKNTASNEDIDLLFKNLSGNYKEPVIEKYSGNKVVIQLNGEKAWLAISERFAHFPGWKAGINGKNLDLYKANNAITAIYLDGGEGKLVFEYTPSSYRTGRLITLIALIIIIIYFGYLGYKKVKRGGQNKT